MKTRFVVFAVAVLLIMAFVGGTALAAGTSYAQYGKAVRQTYGASVNQTRVLAPNSYGAKLGQVHPLSETSYGVQLRQVTLLTPNTYGGKLVNPKGNPNVVPLRPATAWPSNWAW